MAFFVMLLESIFVAFFLLFLIFILPSIIRGLSRKEEDYPTAWARYFNNGKPFRVGGIVLMVWCTLGIIGSFLNYTFDMNHGGTSSYTLYSVLPSIVTAVVGFFSMKYFSNRIPQKVFGKEKPLSTDTEMPKTEMQIAPDDGKTFCKNCGEELKLDWEFCNKCGYPVKNQNLGAEKCSKETATTKAPTTKLICKNCGEELKPDWDFCNKCGYPVKDQSPSAETILEEKPMETEETITKDTAASGETANNLGLRTLPPKLRRAFILIEDEEWEKAEAYFESILDEEPENAYAYLGKALIQIKVDSPVNLTEKDIREICETKNFSRAIKYADGELKQLLDNWSGHINK